MDEIIVRVMRTVACLARLRILSRLASAKERAPTALAEELEMPLGLLCTHLRRLSMAGLIQRRPSGTWCYCRADSPYSEKAFSGRVMSWLLGMLRNPVRTMKSVAANEVGSLAPNELESRLHGIIFEAATAFTHRRRLQILRRLAEGDPVDVPTLMRELHMSETALSRHAGKLKRRGYLKASRVGRCLRYTLGSELKTRLHGNLLEIVRGEWQKEELRT